MQFDASREIGAGRGLNGPEGHTDQEAVEDVGLLGWRGEEAIRSGNGQAHQSEEREIDAGRDDPEGRENEQGEGHEDDEFGAQCPVHAAGDEAAEDRDDIQNDPVNPDFHGRPAEHGGGKHTAQHQKTIDPILIDHARNQETQDVAPMAEFTQGRPDLAKT
ncbi:hypothetical protein VF08_37790 [Nostoc linckia z8]|uniref:Uncharacterized protein n=1 Tax=Nostoc linckia z8 TaxID=1628746 RepID=A0A9Q5Z442_NOSLI|nr:hypothetical protein VF08_37790 [Nostoc linckia z8]